MEEEEASSGGPRKIATILDGTVGGKKKKVALLPSGQTHKKHMVRPRVRLSVSAL